MAGNGRAKFTFVAPAPESLADSIWQDKGPLVYQESKLFNSEVAFFKTA